MRTRINLCSGYALNELGTLTSVRAGVFGELVKLAAPVLEHYHSDLFHDAEWLGKYLNGPMEFYFSVDDSGTCIGIDERVTLYRAKHYHIIVALDERLDKWSLEIREGEVAP